MPTMRLLAHHPLDGFGNCGEGMAIQLTLDRRRVLWIAHESQPKNVTAVDVTYPKKPSVIVHTALPHHQLRSNSLDLVGGVLDVAEAARPRSRPCEPCHPAHDTHSDPGQPHGNYGRYSYCGALVLDVAYKAHPSLLGRRYDQPFCPSFSHTVVPLFDRSLLVVS